jgi:hypothetical protein
MGAGGAGGRARGGLVVLVAAADRAPVVVVGVVVVGVDAVVVGGAVEAEAGNGSSAGAGGGGAVTAVDGATATAGRATGPATGAPEDRWAPTMRESPATAMTTRTAAATVSRRPCAGADIEGSGIRSASRHLGRASPPGRPAGVGGERPSKERLDPLFRYAPFGVCAPI